MAEALAPNPGKQLYIRVGGAQYARFPIKTPVVRAGDDLQKLVAAYVAPHIKKGDVLFMSERIVAISQGRAWKISEIQPSRMARILTRFVHKSPYGIGLGSPWTMELALREAGVARILCAAFIAAVTKPFGVRGMFYKVVGHDLNAIDGPCEYTLPPFNQYAKLGPRDPDGVARTIAHALGGEVVIIDANDLGVNILGRSSPQISMEWAASVFKDNPLGQSREQTPMAIVRACGTVV